MLRKNLVVTLILLPFVLLARQHNTFLPRNIHSAGTPARRIERSTEALRICALQVTFSTDALETTTGDGTFLMESVTGSELCPDFIVDPPPHNRAYFRDHIRAVANYYDRVSQGQVRIDTVNSAVYPLNDQAYYQLSHQMDYYHPFLAQDSVDLRLGELLRDAVVLADPEVDFAQYDLVVIFHAGVGQDFAITLDPTPYDIPSAFINASDLEATFGADYPGIAVEDGAHFVREGIILPETQNHILYPNWEEVFGAVSDPCAYQIGLNGTFAFLMGFYLGLPALYDTETGDTGIGKFGLMDQGSANLNGLIPPLPCAWERVFMGWDTPVVAGAQHLVNLPHAEADNDSLIWKIPINDHEYFLIENRSNWVRPGVSLDSMQYKRYQDDGSEDWPSILPFVRDSIAAEFSPQTGVLLSVPRYDVGLPGAGLLIWHIDETVIQANLTTNRVNVDREHRGVDLEEGDGAQDLGYPSQLLGASVDIGWFFDFWFAGNEGFWDMNPNYLRDSLATVGFTPETNPDTRSNNLTPTGIVIDQIGPAAQRMQFCIRREWGLPGFPLPVASPNIALPIPLDGDETEGHFMVITDSVLIYSETGALESHAKISDIQMFSDNLASIVTTSGERRFLFLVRGTPDSSFWVYSWEILQDLGINLINQHFFENQRLASNILARDGELLFQVQNLNSGSSQLVKYSATDDQLDTIDLSNPLAYLFGSEPQLLGWTSGMTLSLVSCAPLELQELNNQLSLPSESAGESILVHLNDNESPDIVLAAGGQIFTLLDPQLEATTIQSSENYTLSDIHPVVGDINGDRVLEIVFADAQKIYAFSSEFTLCANFPISIPNLYRDQNYTPFLLTAELDGDGALDILAFIRGVGLIAYNFKGQILPGYPIALPDILAQSGTLIPAAGGTGFIAITEDRRQIVGLKLSSQPVSESAWRCYGANPGRNFVYPITSELPLISGTGLMDQKRTYNWPNPVKSGQTAFRYFVRESCEISIKIYDLAGDFVTRLKETDPKVGIPGEIAWDASGIENGVYFAVVQATRGNKSEEKIVKVMIVR